MNPCCSEIPKKKGGPECSSFSLYPVRHPSYNELQLLQSGLEVARGSFPT
jgi:hypothetical protein